MDYIIARTTGNQGYDLFDPHRGYIGRVVTLEQLHRFAEAEGAPLEFENAAVETARGADWIGQLRTIVHRVWFTRKEVRAT